jgi:hypothetical protein
MYNHLVLPKCVSDRLTDKDRSLLNKEKTTIEEENDLTKKAFLIERFRVISYGVVFNMCLNKKLSFYKEYKKCSKQYDNVMLFEK